MNADEYESLPTQSMWVHMAAGACAGVMEHCIMYSVDSVKTRRQILTPGPGGGVFIFTEIGNMMRQEGIFRPFKGISAMVAGAGPAHALYFSCYEYLKNKMMTSKSYSQNQHVVYASAGVVSTVIHDCVMNPAEVVKQRMQMPNSPYRSATDCLRHVYATEGARAFYRSYGTSLLMNVPFQSIHFVTYELAQAVTNPQRKYNVFAHLLSGGLAGAVAATVSMPLDVCKTVLNTQVGEVRASGMTDALCLVYRYWGLSGYYRGLTARIMYQTPATAICWTTYELFKYLLQGQSVSASPEAVDDLPLVKHPQAPRSTTSPNTSTGPGGTNSNSFQGAGLYFNQKPVMFDVTRG